MHAISKTKGRSEMERLDREPAELIDEDVPGPRRDLVGYGPSVPVARWPNEARVAVSLIVNYEEGSEYAIQSGDGRSEALSEMPRSLPNGERDLRVESVFEYGSRAGVWRLMRLFDSFDIRVTFFAAAIALERNAELAAAIRMAGHEVAGHGWRWSEHWRMSRDEEKQRLDAAVRSLERTCGKRPQGWYCRYAPTVHTRELLVEYGGFLYDSDAYNDDLPYFVQVSGKQHLVVPYTLVYNDYRFVSPQGFASARDFFETCKAGFDYLWDEGATHPRMMSIGLHPRLAGQAARAAAVKDFIEYAQTRGGVWFARRVDIAEYWWREMRR